jgi:hypothetical protein
LERGNKAETKRIEFDKRKRSAFEVEAFVGEGSRCVRGARASGGYQMNGACKVATIKGFMRRRKVEAAERDGITRVKMVERRRSG